MSNKAYIMPMLAMTLLATSCDNGSKTMTVGGGDDVITFVGRTDYSTKEAPKQWAAGGYFTFGFEGNTCYIELNDEVLYGNKYNIIEVCVDDVESKCFYTKGIRNIIAIDELFDECDAKDTAVNYMVFNTPIGNKEHHVTICRDTETAMGYTQLISVSADNIFKWTPATSLKMEFIGNSITCGAEADTTLMARDQYQWGDWHRAYYGYGPRTARNLNAQWSLVSVSGIGLIHSCCDMDITMPQVYDKMMLRDNKLSYDFGYKPDVICCCLGQNDGIQDSTAFCTAYVDFIKTVKQHNPQAKKIVLLTSPMDNGELSAWLKRMLASIVDKLTTDGMEGVSYFAYSKAWNNGGAMHPSANEHEEIADELTSYIKTIL